MLRGSLPCSALRGDCKMDCGLAQAHGVCVRNRQGEFSPASPTSYFLPVPLLPIKVRYLFMSFLEEIQSAESLTRPQSASAVSSCPPATRWGPRLLLARGPWSAQRRPARQAPAACGSSMLCITNGPHKQSHRSHIRKLFPKQKSK